MIANRHEAEAALRKLGVHTLGKNSGDMMLLAAAHGLINVIKHFEGP